MGRQFWAAAAVTASILATASIPAVASPNLGRVDAAGRGTVTPATLEQTLKDAGYSPERPEGQSFYLIRVQHNGWKHGFRVSLSRSERKLWVQGYLAKIENLDTAGSARLAQLLAAANEHGPVYFTVTRAGASPDTKAYYVWANLPVDNRAVSADVIRTEVLYLANVVQKTVHLWDPGKWTSGS